MPDWVNYMSVDIQFGEMEEAQPSRRLRPDQDLHYAVVPCQNPREGDLPVFVYLDAMLDMESHASSDTRVELGGVLLGGQYEDAEGRPFVVVRDCLRAEHYEATKGSFKFTHETWEQITRQREQFDPDFEMVGWYHTHPDWGVFLSGMDMFICDNFFNRSLDVALVIDPCRGDRGWFQWTGAKEERVRRTGGFYLISSRYREAELEYYAAVLGGQGAMSFQPHTRSIAGQIGPAQPIINVQDRQSPVQTGVLIGLLMVQFIMMFVLGYRLLAPDSDARELVQKQQQEEAVLRERLQQLEASHDQDLRVDVQQELLNQVVASMNGGEAIEWLNVVAEERAQNRRLTASIDAHIVAAANLQRENSLLSEQYATSKSRGDLLAEKLKEEARYVDQLEQQVKDLKASASDAGKNVTVPFYRDWRALLVMVVLVVIAAGSGCVFGMNLDRSRRAEELLDAPFEGERRQASQAEHIIDDSGSQSEEEV